MAWDVFHARNDFAFFLITWHLISSLLLVLFSSLLYCGGHIVVNARVNDLELGAVPPFHELLEHEALTVFNGVLAIKSAEHLHRPG